MTFSISISCFLYSAPKLELQFGLEVTDVLFLAAFIGIASGSKGGVSLPFALAVTLGFTWISLLMNRLKKVARFIAA